MRISPLARNAKVQSMTPSLITGSVSSTGPLHFEPMAKCQGPVDDTDPVIRLGIVGLQLNVFLMVGLGFLKFFGIKWRATHQEKDRADLVVGREIVRIFLQNLLEFLDGLIPAILVLFRGRTRDVQAGVSSAEIQARVQKIGVRLLGLLKILNGRVGLAVLKGIYALIEQIPRLQLVAAGSCKCENQDGRERSNPASS